MAAAIELHGVEKRFRQKTAVDGVDLVVPAGSIYGFIGPNGSGKTTTMRLILRILQPDAGQVVVLGADQGTVADDRIGYLPEERGLYKRMKVLELIDYFARLKGRRDGRDEGRRWLARLGAADWADKRLDTLSKGMAQKGQFIVAVVARPQLVILDEPFSGLDPVNLETLQDAVAQLRREGATIVLSTHDMHVAARMCDFIFMIHDGRKVLDGSLAEIQRQYPVSCVRLRLAEGATLPALSSVRAAKYDGRFHLLTLGDGATPQAVLHEVAECNVEHFEVVRPTLHDIFVDVVRQSGREVA
ncbi:MAG TPA: ATP-binding cassette domain-containing protein [Lacipirellulaceae bacterium]|nr:ATP-binding cassette domain-containing protein [Lacipirellulaceae bacterium]